MDEPHPPLNHTMKAIIVRAFGGPEVMRLEDAPDPTPGPSDVLVRIRAAGVNPVDAYIRSGTYPRKPALPYTPGLDGAGEIEAAGSEVRGFAAGDRVYVIDGGHTGTYAERAISPATRVFHLPDRVSYGQGAAMGVPYATAYRALFQRAGARAGETVLVHGATGGVGLAAVQLAHHGGLVVIGTGGTDRGLEIVRRAGADHVLLHNTPDYLDGIMRVTEGRGVDIVIEMAAHINLDKDLSLLARYGRVVVVGNRGRVEIDARQAMGRDAAILGMTLFNVGPADLAGIHAALGAGLRNGSLQPIIGREFPLAEAARAHEAIMEPGAFGKIVLLA